jgi:transposase
METITLNTKEQRRIEVLTRVAAGTLERTQAMQLLGCSARTLHRAEQRLEKQGVAGMSHGNRGRAPQHKTSAVAIAQVHALVAEGGDYQGFNVTHLQEMLAEREGLCLGRSTLDRLLKQQGLLPPRKGRKRRVFRRRERMTAAGMLLQIDGSPHDWLEGRGPRMTLMGAIDDATSQVLYLRFHLTEDQAGYLLLLRTIIQQHGLPMSLYHDRHTILRSPKSATLEDELAGREPMSQVQRVLHALGIESIPARTPQAKGRIERLWGTLQDRLVSEMRLAGVGSLEEANAFLSEFLLRFNARFAQEPQDKASAWVCAEPPLDTAYYFSTREERTVRSDQTLSYQSKTLLIVGPKNYRGRKVSVHQVPEGELYVYDGKERLAFKSVATRPLRPIPAKTAAVPATVTATEKLADPQAAARKRAWLYGHSAGGGA